ncbi:histone H3 methyltransferase complex and RNA cleavage factor II complex, subunit SWD2 [Purpureocillium lavendulum]|uniref:Histone H3 methyltransferase complex and RNA cleavage factor II complex, subunit SWD2 n=1 Tax=Purpureocillium lavendulum TaxID=1247861 RepID=A0AB34GA81_9HYPO|nr:histone H3 methyltransferase complex and RNA cleavage factor II complex, subunit SWD2 [Purpureocillium lavendulum]
MPPVWCLEQAKDSVCEQAKPKDEASVLTFDLQGLPMELQMRIFREAIHDSKPNVLKGVVRPLRRGQDRSVRDSKPDFPVDEESEPRIHGMLLQKGTEGTQRSCAATEASGGGCQADCKRGKRRAENVLGGLEKLSVRLGPVLAAGVNCSRLFLLWVGAWDLIDRMCPRLQELTLLEAKSDLCTDDPTIEARRRQREVQRANGRLIETEPCWLKADMLPLVAATMKFLSTNFQDFFPGLTMLRIRLVESVCYRDMVEWNRGNGQQVPLGSELVNTRGLPDVLFQHADDL